MAGESIFNGRVVCLFNEAKHTYSVRIPELGVNKGQWLPSVTGVLNVLSKDALIPWAVGQAKEYAEKRVHEVSAGRESLPIVEIENVLAEAQECWRDLSKATSIGSISHRFLHAELEYRAGVRTERPKMTVEPDLVLAPEFTQEMLDAANLSVTAGLEYLDSNHVEPLYFERILFSPEHSYIGRCDLIAKVNGVLSIVDFKTSKNLYEEYFLQLAAYQAAFACEFPERVIHNRIAVNIRKDGTGLDVETRDLSTYAADLECFIAALTAYKWRRVNNKWRPSSAIPVFGMEWLKNA